MALRDSVLNAGRAERDQPFLLPGFLEWWTLIFWVINPSPMSNCTNTKREFSFCFPVFRDPLKPMRLIFPGLVYYHWVFLEASSYTEPICMCQRMCSNSAVLASAMRQRWSHCVFIDLGVWFGNLNFKMLNFQKDIMWHKL